MVDLMQFSLIKPRDWLDSFRQLMKTRIYLLTLRRSLLTLELTCVEIIFIADYTKRSTFILSDPTTLGLLKEFGWECGEEMDKVKVTFMKGWNDE